MIIENVKVADMVNEPPHYQAEGMQCIDAIEAQLSKAEFIGFLRGTIAKYQWRLGKKGAPVEDAKKSEWYLKRLIVALGG